MTKKILVAYASHTGTTADVAEAIGAVMREHGAEAHSLYGSTRQRASTATKGCGGFFQDLPAARLDH